MTPSMALRLRLKDLRKRRGAFRSHQAAQMEEARILAALPAASMERRVFELCELGGAPYKSAAVHLGVSERQLYRIRAALYERLAAQQLHVTVAPMIEMGAQQLEFARSLLKCGQTDRCEETLSRVLATSLPPIHTADALVLRSMAYSNRERYGEAAAALDTARRFARTLPADQATRTARAIGMAQAYIPYRDGLSDRAIAISEAAIGHDETPPADPFETRALARDLIFLGIQHEDAGSPRRGLGYLMRARALLERLPVPPAAELAQVLIHTAFGRAALADQSAQAHRDAEQALRLSQWHGLQYEEMWSSLVLGVLHEMAGKAHEGLAAVRHALDLAHTVADGDPLIRALFLTARVEGASGRSDDALARLDEARPLARNHGLLRGILEVAQARAHRHRGELDKTISSSTRAIDVLEGRAMTHYLGIPYLARALARSNLGVRPVDDLERALHYLTHGGSLSDQAQALDLSYRLTGNTRHRSAADELRFNAARIA